MKFRTAETEELCKLKKMYDDVIDHQSQDEYGAGWTKDVYPSRDDLERHLKEDLVYVIDDDDEFRGAGIISLYEDEMYKNAPWSRGTGVHLEPIDARIEGRAAQTRKETAETA